MCFIRVNLNKPTGQTSEQIRTAMKYEDGDETQTVPVVNIWPNLVGSSQPVFPGPPLEDVPFEGIPDVGEVGGKFSADCSPVSVRLVKRGLKQGSSDQAETGENVDSKSSLVCALCKKEFDSEKFAQ